MSNNDNLQQRVNQKLADATSEIIAQARAKDYEEADRLMHAQGVSFGIGMLVLGTGVLALAAIFHRVFSWASLAYMAIAFLFWIIGAIFIDTPNWLRKRLVRRLLNRSSSR